ncbi:MAG: RNA polymerase sigma factor [Planctomycetota bacterium]
MLHDDAKAVQAVLAGDKSAYGELYERYARLVRAICFDTTGDLIQAQDLSQEVFHRAYRRLAELRDPGRFGNWLVGIARLVCKEWKRARSRDRHRYFGLDPAAAPAAASVAENDHFEQLHKAILSLRKKERLAVQAFYLQGQSVERARAVLGLSRSGFYRVLQCARERLARLMRDYREDIP